MGIELSVKQKKALMKLKDLEAASHTFYTDQEFKKWSAHKLD